MTKGLGEPEASWNNPGQISKKPESALGGRTLERTPKQIEQAAKQLFDRYSDPNASPMYRKIYESALKETQGLAPDEVGRVAARFATGYRMEDYGLEVVEKFLEIVVRQRQT